jgi:class 3 adenylate cyclase/tetratricopeptide (TPR) repeat protein
MDDRAGIERAIAAQEGLRGTVPDDIVDTTVAALRARLDEIAPSPDKRRRQVTVVFADVAGSTEFGDARDPEEVDDVYEALWARLDRVVTAHNGRVDKHIGDAVMALWGASEAREDDPEQAIRAALGMQEAAAAMPAGHLALRIGVNTGPALIGEVGTTGEFTAIGDTVNVAARLESAAPVGGVLIGHDTYRHVKGVFAVRPRDPITVKGKSRPLRTYVVDGVRPRAFRVASRGVEGVETAMIGRDDELAILQRTLRETETEGISHLVTVIGEAGIGKSRLLNAFEDWLTLREEEPWLFRGRADQTRRGVPFAVLRDLLFFRFGVAETDPGADAIAKLENGITGFLGPEGVEAAHLLGHLAGLDLSASAFVGGILDDARQLRERATSAAVRLFAAAAADAPVCLLLEDLHWADGGSLDLVEEVLGACADSPVFALGLARPQLFEQRPDWGSAGSHHRRIDLEPLSEDDSRHLVGEILQRLDAVPEAVAATILEHAEGNPFYVEEMVKMLIDGGVITTGDDAWTVAADRLEHVPVPPTLTGVIQSRLDRLPDGERRTLQRASVVGRVFWDEAIPTDTPAPEGDDAVRRHLAALGRRALIDHRDAAAFSGTEEYAFHHALLHEVTYDTVLLKDRRPYHRQIADWLVRRTEGAGHAAAVAGHYLAADVLDEAAAWYARAGADAAARYANDEAVDHYRRALDLGTLPVADRLRAYEGLGEVLLLQARYDEALATAGDMQRLAETVHDDAAAASALVGTAFPLLRMGRSREALDACRRAEQILRGLDPPDGPALAEALRSQGWMLLRLGEGRRALGCAEEALSLATAAGDRRGTARCLALLGGIHNILGDYATAAGFFEQALEIDRERGDRHAETAWLINLGESARFEGDYRRAVDLQSEALAIEDALGDRDQQALTLSNLGGAYLGMGDHRAAIEHLERSLQLFAATGNVEHVSETHRFLAEAALALGAADRARSEARTALSQANPDDAEQVGHAWRVLGLVAAATQRPVPVGDDGESVDAATCFMRSIDTFTAAGLEHERAHALWDRARIEWESGDRTRAATWWEEARETFGRLGLDRFVAAMDAERSPPGRATPPPTGTPSRGSSTRAG